MSFRSAQAPPPPPPPRQPRRKAVNLPPVVGVLIAVNVAIYLLGAVLPYRWTSTLLLELGFVPVRLALADGVPLHALASTLSHQFLHAGPLHVLVNMIMLAAFGSGVEKAIGGRRLLLLYFASGIAGAAAHYAFYPMSQVPVVGASGAISGLFGAILRLMAKHSAATGGSARVWPVAAIWIGIAVITGFTGAPGAGEAQVAWAAHVGGFVLGFALFDLFALGQPLPGKPRRRPEHLRDLDDEP